jgi:hypothetical protein
MRELGVMKAPRGRLLATIKQESTLHVVAALQPSGLLHHDDHKRPAVRNLGHDPRAARAAGNPTRVIPDTTGRDARRGARFGRPPEWTEPLRWPGQLRLAHRIDQRVEPASGAEVADGPCRGQITPRAKKVLEITLRDAIDLGQQHIQTEHLLLAMLTEDEGVAVQVLTALDVSTTTLRHALLDRVRREAS